MAFNTQFDLYKQSTQGRDARKVLQYDDGHQIQEANDLITKGYVDPLEAMLKELLPAQADSLDGNILEIYQNTTTRYLGYLSVDALAAYNAGQGAGSEVTYIVKDRDFVLNTPTPETGINKGDKGLLEMYVNGALVDSFDLASAFNEANRDGSQVYTLQGGGTVTMYRGAAGKLRILSVDKYADFTAYQKVVALLDLAASDFVVGYNTITLKHINLDTGDQVSQDFQIFSDVSTVDPSLDPISVVIEDNTHPKHLSGVRYLGANDVVKVSTGGNALFDNTYVQDPVQFAGNGFPTTTLSPVDSSISGVSNPPVKAEKATITDKLITLSVANKCDADARLTGTPRDPFGTYAGVTSPSVNLLLSTFGARSTDTREYFDDEEYRLPLSFNPEDTASSVKNHWDSVALLSSADAQQYIVVDNDHGLMYANLDFTGFQPANTANYSGFSGEQRYMRAFLASSPKASINLTLQGLAGGVGAVGSGDVNVEIKLGNQTGWLDAAKALNGSLGVGADGLGCMVGNISYSGGNALLQCTFGGKSSYDSNGRVFVRITLRNGNRSIRQIDTNW